jgi:hypothetical protein
MHNVIGQEKVVYLIIQSSINGRSLWAKDKRMPLEPHGLHSKVSRATARRNLGTPAIRNQQKDAMEGSTGITRM